MACKTRQILLLSCASIAADGEDQHMARESCSMTVSLTLCVLVSKKRSQKGLEQLNLGLNSIVLQREEGSGQGATTEMYFLSPQQKLM